MKKAKPYKDTLCKTKNCPRVAVARGWCRLHYQRWYVTNNPDYATRAWDGCCDKCGQAGATPSSRLCKRCMADKSRAYRAGNLDQVRAWDRALALTRYHRNRDAVLAAYGGKCTCCGEWRKIFLAIDHVDGKGNEHRRSLSTGKYTGSSSHLYRYLIKNNFPPTFQIHCHNCNFAKSNGGCPHQKVNNDERRTDRCRKQRNSGT